MEENVSGCFFSEHSVYKDITNWTILKFTLKRTYKEMQASTTTIRAKTQRIRRLIINVM